MFSLADKFPMALIKYSFLQPCLALPSAWMKQCACKCFMKNTMPIIPLTQVEKPRHREGSIPSWARLLSPPQLRWSRDHYPAGWLMVSCSLLSPFPKKTRLSRGTLVLGAGMWDHPEGMPVCLATAAGGDNGLSQSVHPPAKYSIGADSIFGMHFKCAFQQEPCRISATDPAAGLPGGSCPFPARKDVPGTESSRGACRQPHTPRARPAGLGKAGSVAADCCLLLIRSFFRCLAAGVFFCPFSPLRKLV